jgi:hypothetical protein
MASDRPVRFEIHIRQIVRLLERDNMLFKFDLWNYDQVKAHADKILSRIGGDRSMPPAEYGGPWPLEWVALFQRWKDEGFGRLDLGTADLSLLKATRTGNLVKITAKGQVPSPGYVAWLDAAIPESGKREYTLYWEPPAVAEAPSPTPFDVDARFKDGTGMTQIIVQDSAGPHTVAIQGS